MIEIKEELLIRPSKITSVEKSEWIKYVSNGFFKKTTRKGIFQLRIDVDNGTYYGRSHLIRYGNKEERDAHYLDLKDKLKEQS